MFWFHTEDKMFMMSMTYFQTRLPIIWVNSVISIDNPTSVHDVHLTEVLVGYVLGTICHVNGPEFVPNT